MTLEFLFNTHGQLDWRDQPPKTIPTSLCFDSRRVVKDSVYVAVRGHQADGHDYILAAIKEGACALVVEESQKVPVDYRGAVFHVLDSRLTLQSLSQRFYSFPGESLFSVAVTGTNGKTSSAYILEYLLNKQNFDCGVIGTIDHHFKGKHWETSLTTPDPVSLQSRLQDFVDNGAKSFVMEASSHALDQQRIGQGFDGAIFTNLSRDHLDYHQDMESYFKAKEKLFKEGMLKESSDCFAVINTDDEYGIRLTQTTMGRRVYTYGKASGSHLRFSLIADRLDGADINLTVGEQSNFLVNSPLLGEHNAYNLVGALAVIYAMGLNLVQAAEDIQRFPGIPGRMQRVTSAHGIYGFVDYAHTPDAMESVLKGLQSKVKSPQKLITVFGCGGDRDKGKRPQMGKIASLYSDTVIVTSDNPRSEDPGQIIKEIVKGASTSTKKVMPFIDREEAIAKACEIAQPGDVVLVAGKGHEAFQTIAGQKLPFDDLALVTKYLKN